MDYFFCPGHEAEGLEARSGVTQGSEALILRGALLLAISEVQQDSPPAGDARGTWFCLYLLLRGRVKGEAYDCQGACSGKKHGSQRK